MIEFEDNADIGAERSAFAQWLAARLGARGTTLRRTAVEIGIDYSYLYKVLNSHKEAYSQYRRPGYAYTVRIGRHFRDLAGALRAAGYEGSVEVEERPGEQASSAAMPSARDEARDLIRRLNSLLAESGAPSIDPLRRLGEDVDITNMASMPIGSVAASAGVSTLRGDADRADDTLAEYLPNNVRPIRISGDCMLPEYRDGDIVLVRETQRVNNGDIVIAVSVDGGEVMCKQFRDDRGRGRRLEPLNKEAADSRHLGAWEYRIVGIVAGSIRIGR
jgi:SOS-response transcriptional repressor LexA